MTSLQRGLGLRREFAKELAEQPRRDDIDFLEVVPDNWMGLGGESRSVLDALAARYPLIAHGLSLSIGDAMAIDMDYLKQVHAFLDRYGIALHSDHLSLSRDEHGYLYDLVPVPRTQASIDNIVGKIDAVQSVLNRRLALENSSYYVQGEEDMPEVEFIARIVKASGCGLLLDVNNVHVNASNFGTDPHAFLQGLPADSVMYYHTAGHARIGGDLPLLDTHGAPVCEAVVRLGQVAVSRFGDRPLVLERDHHLPSLDALCSELGQVHQRMFGHIDRAAA